MDCRMDQEVARELARPRGLVLERREREALFLEGPDGDRAYLTVLEVEHGRAALQLDLPQVGNVVLFLDARAQGRAKLQIAAPRSVQILRTECEADAHADAAAACC
jgi:sRNA-binding carbon storage regulator CsrA